jgi:prepilin-type N-terminal cleavage/methylation domain-containing protein
MDAPVSVAKFSRKPWSLPVLPKRQRAAAFTLIELLVVMAIIAVLTAVLLPAIMRVRAAANNVSCKNNLKQIGIAFINYHDHNGRFPSGGIAPSEAPNYLAPGQPAGPGKQHGGWGFQILPYLEESNIYCGGGATTIADCQLTAISTPIRVLFCPGRRLPEVGPGKPSWYQDGPPGNVSHAFCDYAAAGFEGNPWPGIVLQGYRGQSMVRIRDGCSNTLLAADKRLNLWRLDFYRPDDHEGYTCAWGADTMRFTTLPPLPDYYETGGGDGGKRFGSSHADAFNAVFADGSTHSILYTIDPSVFASLGCINDGGVIDWASIN